MSLSCIVAYSILLLRFCLLVHSHRKARVDVSAGATSKLEVANYTTPFAYACDKLHDAKSNFSEEEKLRDPDYALRAWLKKKAKESLNLEIIFRPVSSRSRELMCTGKGVGKGLDIKGKSSKTTGLNRGFVPFCQDCSFSGEDARYDLYEDTIEKNGSTRKIYVVGMKKRGLEVRTSLGKHVRNQRGSIETATKGSKRTKSKSDTKGDQSGTKRIKKRRGSRSAVARVPGPNVRQKGNPAHLRGGLCANRNTMLAPTKCRATYRSPDKDLQHKMAYSLLKGGSANTPLGVERRVILMKAHEGSGRSGHRQDQPLPFIGYETIDIETKKRMKIPVVSDYDILSIAECPHEATGKLKPEARYPMYNGDPDFFDTTLFQDLVFASIEKYQKMVQAWLKTQHDTHNMMKATWLNTQHDTHNGKVKSVMNRLQYEGLGLGDRSSMAVIKSLVDHSRDESKSGAIRHGAEAFNYIFPQPFADQMHPRFNSTKRVQKMSSTGVIEHYMDLLGRGCCVPMNYLWLLYPTEGPEWVKFWVFAMAKVADDNAKFAMAKVADDNAIVPDTSIIGCRFYDYITFGEDSLASKIKGFVEVFVKEGYAASASLNKTFNEKWFEDINGDGGSPCLEDGDCG